MNEAGENPLFCYFGSVKNLHNVINFAKRFKWNPWRLYGTLNTPNFFTPSFLYYISTVGLVYITHLKAE